MAASTQRAITVGQKTAFDGLSLLDDKVLAMIIGQNPLEHTLEALCREIEKQHPGCGLSRYRERAQQIIWAEAQLDA